jgi:hypothetical protein
MVKGIEKFNSGQGALCCPNCKRIVATGFHPNFKELIEDTKVDDELIIICAGCGTEVEWGN